MNKEPYFIKSDDPEQSKMYVKFSNNITFLESYLKQNNIPYEQEDLEDTPLGRGYVVRRD